MKKTMTKPLLFAAGLSLLTPFAVLAEDDVQKVHISGDKDSEWSAYRHAYKANAFFAPFLRTRPLIQAHMQVRPMAKDVSMDGLRLHLAGARTRQDIAVDAVGRAVLPMDKQAYEDDAVLTLNRQKGQFYFSGRYSLRERDDGIYQAADLRAGCDQLLSAQRASGYRMRLLGKQCAGVKLVFAKDAAPDVLLRLADGKESALDAKPDTPFEDGSIGQFQVVHVNFATLPAGAQVLARTKPLAIGTRYE